MSRVRHLAAGAAVAVAAIGVSGAPTDAAGARAFVSGAILTGAAEVSGGDPDGIGIAGVLISPDRETLCYAVGVRRIESATLAHIHRGVAGVDGPVVVHFQAPSDGFSADCVEVDPALGREIAGNPRGFYVNVHNGPFGGGAVRGQLR